MQIFKETTVRHLFKRCGLCPFDSEVICKDLRADEDKEPDLVVYDQGKQYELPEWNQQPLDQDSRLETPPASSSTINSPPMTSTKLRQDISKARKNFAAFTESSATIHADVAKISQYIDFIFEGRLTQA